MLKATKVKIDPEAPFLNDELNRLESAEILMEFVLSMKEPTVICIDAPWGQGKTTFLGMWEQHLRNNSIPTLQYNAWENDFSDDALISIIGEMSYQLDNLSFTGDIEKTLRLLNKAKKLSVSLLKKSLPVMAKVATAGVLDFDKITEQALSNFSESIAKEKLESYEKSKNTVSSFKNALHSLASSLTPQESSKPLVFIIDELDRCRPNFSIEILEKIKHFFNVDNIVFVLAADKVELGHSIKAIYGQGLDVNCYLRKFIDFDYQLPPPPEGQYAKSLFKKFNFHRSLNRRGRSSKVYLTPSEEVFNFLTNLFDIYRLTLREQESCCALLSLAIRTTKEGDNLHPLFLCYLIVLKIKNPSIYQSFISESLLPIQLFEYYSSKKDEKIDHYSQIIEAYLMASNSHKKEGNTEFYNVIDKLHEVILNESEDREKRANAIVLISLIEEFIYDGGVWYVIKKIEIASRFGS
ncbi:hypothetical protein J8L73_12260 [Pseudoalteromonas sp. MMG006]|uniref:KAP family P-loop NTPase fold protein n=1 Tax=Pseudoalteromonas sp. MMG006 TaxID=2822683 RepID=UPI001B35D5B7|nr:P-loop NTPase fold protein [Pseudoalteromonas sp. MMG006]MBQ4799895.1 hypothetical protein [Pseudoalteromonas sp. MMG006]